VIAGRVVRIVRLGFKGIAVHKLRSSLTVLGIVFGVASVIAMLSIGEGASYEAQEQIKALGSNNIIVRSVKPPEDQRSSAERSRVSEYGITYEDAEVIRDTLPYVDVIVPVREIRKDVRFLDRRANGRILGTVPWLQEVMNRSIARGRFLASEDVRASAAVCVLGSGVASQLFLFEEPLGALVKLGSEYFRVIGIMSDRASGFGGEAAAGFDVYIPITTAREWYGETLMKISSGSRDMEKVELHELQVRVDDSAMVRPVAGVVRDILDRRHTKADYDVLVPLELLMRAEATKRIFNIVLGSIAGISLLVGGIGIMNIMLASVTERTREIGIRRALGAKRRDIVVQFLVETVVLSLCGGLAGVALGVTIPAVVTHFSELRTIVQPFFLLLAFSISGLIGIVFGLYPAWRAAQMDPIEALRHE
jgi:putative ABC transport system permease protein